jgi:U6 snRNA-associated Sm-like protein LSm2
MLFYSFFKTQVGKTITVELKNDVSISGNLSSVDQFLNLKLTGITVAEAEKYPYLLSVKDLFIRGSVIRYVSMDKGSIDGSLLQAATRREFDLIKNKAAYQAEATKEGQTEGEDQQDEDEE